MRGATRNEDWPPHDFEVSLGQKASIVPNVEENCLSNKVGNTFCSFVLLYSAFCEVSKKKLGKNCGSMSPSVAMCESRSRRTCGGNAVL